MTHCPSCNSAVSAHPLACPKCGATFDDTSSPTAMLPDEPAALVDAWANGTPYTKLKT